MKIVQTENNILNDLSSLTNLSKVFFTNIGELEKLLIGHYVNHTYVNSEDITKIDLGFGYLLVSFNNNEILYKFIPSETLEETLRSVILKGKDPLVSKLETKIDEKVLSAYKGLV